jgi:hypothetical protein
VPVRSDGTGAGFTTNKPPVRKSYNQSNPRKNNWFPILFEKFIHIDLKMKGENTIKKF